MSAPTVEATVQFKLGAIKFDPFTTADQITTDLNFFCKKFSTDAMKLTGKVTESPLGFAIKLDATWEIVEENGYWPRHSRRLEDDFQQIVDYYIGNIFGVFRRKVNMDNVHYTLPYLFEMESLNA